MELTKQELDKIVEIHTIPGNNSRGFVAYLGGHQFRSSNRKTVFPKKRFLMSSLRYNLEYTVRAFIGRHLSSIGSNKWNNPDYVNAWDNFLKQATETGFLQIVELK